MNVKSGGGSIVAASARRRNPRGEGGRLRDDLVRAADRLLGETGDVEGLSLRAVAREAGVTTPSIYLHFPDKGALVGAVVAARFAELAEVVAAATRAVSDRSEQLEAGCLAYCQFGIDHPNAYRVLFGRSASPRPDPTAEGAPPETPLPAAFRFLIDGVTDRLRATGHGHADAFRVATNVWVALHGLVTLRRAVGHFPWPSLIQQVRDVLSAFLGMSRT
ncbi:MAG: TetR/AcrR family transcriptional regulator [Chloroflexota bacterium]